MRDIPLSYIKRREYALLHQRQRQNDVYKQIPLMQQLHQEHALLQSQFALAKLAGNQESIEQFLKQIEHNQQKQKGLLVEHGFDENYLELTYQCAICKDYGFVDGHECVCMQTMRCENDQKMQRSLFGGQTFDQFDEHVFPEENGQRDQMKQLRMLAQSYAENFPNNELNNFLFLGGCGLGKTFTLNCIGAAIVERGFSVRKITGSQFQRLIIDEVIGQKKSQRLEQLMQVDFLAFDDLGSEPPVNDLIAQYFYMLIDERMVAKKSWMITSNLSVENLRERYGIRTFSRLFDKQITKAVVLRGDDLRIR